MWQTVSTKSKRFQPGLFFLRCYCWKQALIKKILLNFLSPSFPFISWATLGFHIFFLLKFSISHLQLIFLQAIFVGQGNITQLNNFPNLLQVIYLFSVHPSTTLCVSIMFIFSGQGHITKVFDNSGSFQLIKYSTWNLIFPCYILKCSSLMAEVWLKPYANRSDIAWVSFDLQEHKTCLLYTSPSPRD